MKRRDLRDEDSLAPMTQYVEIQEDFAWYVKRVKYIQSFLRAEGEEHG